APPVRSQGLCRPPERPQVVKKGHAFRRQGRPLTGPSAKQRDAKLVLQRLDLIADGRLRNAKAFRAAPEAARGAQTGEDLKLSKGKRKIGHYQFLTNS